MMPGSAGQCQTPSRIDDLIHAYILLFIFYDRAPEWIFLKVTEQRLPGWWREMKEIVGGTRFTRLGLTINNSIGK
jgi:hypothetical protein